MLYQKNAFGLALVLLTSACGNADASLDDSDAAAESSKGDPGEKGQRKLGGNIKLGDGSELADAGDAGQDVSDASDVSDGSDASNTPDASSGDRGANVGQDAGHKPPPPPANLVPGTYTVSVKPMPLQAGCVPFPLTATWTVEDLGGSTYYATISGASNNFPLQTQALASGTDTSAMLTQSSGSELVFNAAGFTCNGCKLSPYNGSVRGLVNGEPASCTYYDFTMTGMRQ